MLRRLALVACVASACTDPAVPLPITPGPDAGIPMRPVTQVRLSPTGRLALATSETVPLHVVAVDDKNTETDVTEQATFAIRNSDAASISAGVLYAGPKGSQATTVIATYGGVSSDPLLISTLTPAIDLKPNQAYALSGAAGDHLQMTLPFDAPTSLTNAERVLVDYRLAGGAQLDTSFGALYGDALTVGIDPGTPGHMQPGGGTLSLPVNGAYFDNSWDARAIVLDGTFTTASAGTLYIDRVRVLRQFIVGANLPWLDGAYGHDFGHSYHHPDWPVSYTPDHMDAVLRFAQEQNVRLLRVWVFEGCDGLIKDADEIVTGVDPTLYANFDDLIFRQLPKYDVKVYLTLLVAAHVNECSSPSPLPAGRARDAFLANAALPFVRRYASSPWVWGIDLMNEPEAAVGGPTGNYATGVTWTTMRDFLTAYAAAVRYDAPQLFVSSGSGWHDSTNVQAGQFSGLGFTHLDFHSYNDTGSLPDYATLLRHARVLVGESGQATDTFDDNLQENVLKQYLDDAAAKSYWGLLSWSIDHPGSTDKFTLLVPSSTYEAMMPRPAALVLRALATERGDIGP
jgi:hypothetical protein